MLMITLALPSVSSAGSAKIDAQEVHLELFSLQENSQAKEFPRVVWQTFGNGDTFLSVITDRNRYRSVSVTPWIREERKGFLGEWQKLPSFGISQQRSNPPRVISGLKQERRLRAMNLDVRLGEFRGGARYWLRVEVFTDGYYGSHEFSQPVDLRNN